MYEGGTTCYLTYQYNISSWPTTPRFQPSSTLRAENLHHLYVQIIQTPAAATTSTTTTTSTSINWLRVLMVVTWRSNRCAPGNWLIFTTQMHYIDFLRSPTPFTVRLNTGNDDQHPENLQSLEMKNISYDGDINNVFCFAVRLPICHFTTVHWVYNFLSVKRKK